MPRQESPSILLVAEDAPAYLPLSASLLLVDDDLSFCRSLKRYLEQEGWKVTTANDAAQALTLFQNQPFALVLVDLHLPDLQGDELLARFCEAIPEMPAFLLTAEPEPDSFWKVTHYGAGFLLKPTTEAQLHKLKATLQQALRSSKEKESPSAETAPPSHNTTESKREQTETREA